MWRDRNGMDRIKVVVAVCCGVAFAAVSTAAVSAQKKASKRAPKKIEKLVCKLGTEWNHARIAVQLLNGKVQEFAYYSIWKPRTCSVNFRRADAYSKWVDQGDVTTVTLNEDTGAFLIQHDPKKYHFIFRDIDRMRYCGAEGKINGSLTLLRGNSQCVLDGVMDDDPSQPREPTRALEAETKESSGASKEPAPAK